MNIVLRGLVVVMAVTSAFAVDSSPSAADQRRKKTTAERASAERSHARSESADHVRAVSCDPGGSYAAYPDWARAAFSCGGGRR